MLQLAFLFPGQGAQDLGYLRRLPEHRCVRDTLHEAAEVLGQDPLAFDQLPALRSTVAVQLGLLIAGVSQARALRAEGVVPDAVAGLSVGAFGAAVACGSLDFADALRLVRLRAQAMERAFEHGYGMLAVSGLRQPALEQVLQGVNGLRAEPAAQAWLANLNSASQFVVAGCDEVLDAVRVAARSAGARQAERLDVAVPSHCPLLAPVGAELARALGALRLRDAALPYIANTTARALRAAGDIVRDLADGVMRPVLWHDTNRLLLELGARCVVEMPPGQALSSFIRNLNCQVESLVSDGTSLHSLVLRIRRVREQGEPSHGA